MLDSDRSIGILKRAVKKFKEDNMTSVAAALAYYAFLAIPSALMVAVGIFGLVADPHAVTTVVSKLDGVVPSQARTLLQESLTNMTRQQGAAITVLSVGGLLAFWSL